jgi:hypothetical protein
MTLNKNMFEQIEGDDGIELDAATICFCLGWAPFVIAWVKYNTVFTEWLVQAYFMTVMVLINYPRVYERKNLRKRWFWKAMLCVAILLHPLVLAAMWFGDALSKTKWHDAATMLVSLSAAIIIEFAILGKVVSHFRPVNEADS